MNVEIKEIDQLVWGKSEPRVPLVHHLIEVGACVKVYLEARSSKGVRMLLSEWLGQDENSVIATIGYIFSLHDIGKIHPSFQFRIDEVRDEWIRRAYDPIHDAPTADFRHEVYSEQVMNACWEENGLFPRKVKKLFAAVLRLHHQGKNADAVSGGNKSPWIDIQNDYEKRMRALFCPIGIEREEEIHNRDALGVLLTGLIVLADWVASSEYFGVCDIDADDEACLAWAVERSHETLSAYGLISDVETAFPAQNAFDAMWPNIQRETMRPLQRVCEQIGHISAQLTIIEAPPGEGKTEAALYLAGQLCASMNKRGVYMALPKGSYTAQIILYSPDDIECLAAKVKEEIEKAGSAKEFKKCKAKEFAKLIKDAQVRPITADIALFGRMVTSDCFRDVDAAIQVAHAISTHAVNRESDYFTAVDDLLQNRDEIGAGMMGDTDFNSCCYYEYASLDVDQLKENLKDSENSSQLIRELVPALLRVMAVTNPSGKQNSFAGQILPSLILVECKKDKIPLSYANAFETPVSQYGANPKIVETSIRKLFDEINAMDDAYGLEIAHRAWMSPKSPETELKKGERLPSLTALTAAIGEWMEEQL